MPLGWPCAPERGRCSDQIEPPWPRRGPRQAAQARSARFPYRSFQYRSSQSKRKHVVHVVFGQIKTIFDALFFTFSAVEGRRASSLTSAMSRLTSKYLLDRVQALVTAEVLTQAEGAQLSDTDIGAGFKKIVMEDLHGPKSGELLT